jgi:O-methyltransferase
MAVEAMTGADDPSTALYLDLLKACLTRVLFMNDMPGRDSEGLAKDREIRELGWDWPDQAETMVGMARLNSVHECVETVLRDGVPGDLLEAGVWRGGVAILMRAILAAHGVTDRTVWVADSFRGLPVPDATSFTQDLSLDLSGFDELAVSLDQVKANFDRYGMLDDQVEFLEGWFKDTLPDAPVEQLAVLRLDGDLYESTIQALEALYHKVSPGGFVIIDDYLSLEPCRLAVEDFRSAFAISEEIVEIDWSGVYWRVSG